MPDESDDPQPQLAQPGSVVLQSDDDILRNLRNINNLQDYQFTVRDRMIAPILISYRYHRRHGTSARIY